MGLTPEQLLAVNECGKNIIVSAGAGSGKTRVLTERVFDRIVNPKFKWNIDEMLVLTFTNAAAANMKSRIRNKLLLANEAILDPQEKRKQLNKIDSSYIMTYDAYAQFLVNKHHLLLGIDKNVEVVDANIIKIKTQELLDEIMLEKYRNNDQRFINLINDYCVKDDNELRKKIIDINNKLNSIFDRNGYVDNFENQFFSDEALDETFKQYVEVLKDRIKGIDSLLDSLSEYVENPKNLFPGIENLLYASNYEEIQRSVCIKPNNLPKGSGDEASAIKKKIKELIDELQNSTSTNEETLKKELLSTKDNVLEYLRLAQELNQRIFKYKKENNTFEFFDIFAMATELFDKYPEIREETKNQFKEILIDEYQDTNDLQDEFISRIANNNVYMVGDIKQSIYRFRNANPKLFQNKYENYRNNIDGIKIDLKANFRSRKEVLESINTIFNRLMDAKIGGANYALGHAMQAQNENYEISGNGKIENQSHDLEILNYKYDKEAKQKFPFKNLSQIEVESFVIAKDILDKINNHYQVTYFNIEKDQNGNDTEVMRTRDVQYGDFTILVDRKTEFEEIKQVLTSKGIPADILVEENLNESDLITAIRAVFKMLCCLDTQEKDYDFKFAYMSLARSFLVEMKDSDLYDVVTNNAYEETNLFKKINRIHSYIDLKTISEIIDEFIHEFDVYSKLSKIGDINENFIKIDYLYQLANSLNEAGYTYQTFNNYLVNVFDNSNDLIKYKIQKENNNTVKILNIHKSKGLEYTICYYPLLTKEFNNQDVKSSVVFNKDSGLIVQTMIDKKGLKQTIKKDIFVHNYNIDDIGEKLRLFYVALTRAKEKMILIAPLENKTVKGNVIPDNIRLTISCFADMLNLVYDDISKYIKDIKFEDYRDVIDINYKQYKKNIFNEISDTTEQITIKDTPIVEPIEIVSSIYSKDTGLIDNSVLKKMNLGSNLHYYLETLDFVNPNYELIPNEYKTYIERFLLSDLMINCKSAKSYREYEFIYEENNERKHGIIDLLMEYEDHFDIIDYKTKNIDDEHYDEQLNGYRKYIELISDKKVNCYLYSLLDSTYRVVK